MSTATAGAVPAYVTREILEERDACSDQVELFARTFPDGGEVTAANIRRAAAAGLNLDWFARTFLPMPAQRAYDEATAAAWRAYEEATAPVWRAYDEAMTAAALDYREDTVLAWRVYVDAVAPADRARDEATVVAAWRAYEEAAAAAMRAYDEATVPAGRAFTEAVAAARRAHDEATASALINAMGLAPGSGRSDS